jgi:hypothetical protein
MREPNVDTGASENSIDWAQNRHRNKLIRHDGRKPLADQSIGITQSAVFYSAKPECLIGQSKASSVTYHPIDLAVKARAMKDYKVL